MYFGILSERVKAVDGICRRPCAYTGIAAACPCRGAEPKRTKGDYGKLLIVGGSVGYTGALNLCARSAVRSGAGSYISACRKRSGAYAP